LSITVAKPVAKKRPTWLRVSLWVAGFSAVVTGLIGLMHTPTGMAAYIKVFGNRCPVGGGASAAQVENARLSVVRTVRGTRPAPSRPAFGFRLDVSTRAEVDAWIANHSLDCTDRREHSLLICRAVPGPALGRAGGASIDEVTFAFAPVTTKLVNITGVRYQLSAADAVAQTSALKTEMQATLGTPTRSAGELDEAHMTATAYATVAVVYEFSDYIAELTATNIPGSGVLLREHYMSAVDAPAPVAAR